MLLEKDILQQAMELDGAQHEDKRGREANKREQASSARSLSHCGPRQRGGIAQRSRQNNEETAQATPQHGGAERGEKNEPAGGASAFKWSGALGVRLCHLLLSHVVVTVSLVARSLPPFLRSSFSPPCCALTWGEDAGRVSAAQRAEELRKTNFSKRRLSPTAPLFLSSPSQRRLTRVCASNKQHPSDATHQHTHSLTTRSSTRSPKQSRQIQQR